jgi:hypothetical protein
MSKEPIFKAPFQLEGCDLVASSFPEDVPVSEAMLAVLTPWTNYGPPFPSASFAMVSAGGGVWWSEVHSDQPNAPWYGYIVELRPIAGLQAVETEFTITTNSHAWSTLSGSNAVPLHILKCKIQSAVSLVRVIALNIGMLGGEPVPVGNVWDQTNGTYPPRGNGLVVTGLDPLSFAPTYFPMTVTDPRSRLFLNSWLGLSRGRRQR